MLSSKSVKAIRSAVAPPIAIDPETFFDRVYVVNLDRRPDRWKRFCDELPSDWPFRAPERFSGCDGRRCSPPAWWKQGGGAWGCFRSHLAIVEKCLNEHVRSVLILEDDALISKTFREEAVAFLERVPADWQMLYLGGQHLRMADHPPLRVNEEVYRPFNVNRTHAYALRGTMLKPIYRHLLDRNWAERHHIDHHYGVLHERREHRIYCPKRWLIGQASGRSNVSGKDVPDRLWSSADVTLHEPATERPFVAAIGLHSSGSSCLAGTLHHLGLHLGNRLGGYYGSDPQKSCGFEAHGLARLCEQAIPFPSTDFRIARREVRNRLAVWIRHRSAEAKERGTIAGGKYPLLCRMGNQLIDAAGPGLRVVHIDRDLDESIASLIRRSNCSHDADSLACHQRWLWEGKRKLLAKVPHLTVRYDELLAEPEKQIRRLCEFLELSPTPAQREAATRYVRPEKRHVEAAL